MISVIMPSHNSEKTLDRAVRSVLNQTYKDIELIIVDNGSVKLPRLSDDILMDTRVKMLVYAEVLGAAEARNVGVREAGGEYIAFLDSDDYWTPDKLEKQIKVMERFVNQGETPRLVFTGRSIIDSDGRETGRYIGCNKIVRRELLLRSNQINCSSVLLRRETALKFPFPDGDIHEDYVVWLEVLEDGGYAAGINRPLLKYTKSGSSKSGNKIRSAIMTYNVYRYVGISRLESLKHMITYTIYGIKKHYLS